MSSFRKGDFLYGALLSSLTKKDGQLMLLSKRSEKPRSYQLETDNGEYAVFMAYNDRPEREPSGHMKWEFEPPYHLIETVRKTTGNIRLAILLGSSPQYRSQMLILDEKDIQTLFADTKDTKIIIRRKSYERHFAVSRARARGKVHLVRINRSLDDSLTSA